MFFGSLLGEWDSAEFEDLLAILLWLGLCYKGRDETLFIPALIREDGTSGDCWGPSNLDDHVNGQWVMGYSIEHSRSEIALAPIALWHRFQVELAQTPRFNGETLDNDFSAGKYFVQFKVDYMAAWINVNADEERPTFDHIDILVKPLPRRDSLESDMRKQCQVDLANDLVEILLGLWDHVCPNIGFVQRIIWPWPVVCLRPQTEPQRNLEMTHVRRCVEEHGVGREMQWSVGFDSITEDQLLSTKDKEDAIKSLVQRSQFVHRNNCVGIEGIMEAVELHILPGDMLHEAEPSGEGSPSKSREEIILEAPFRNTVQTEGTSFALPSTHLDVNEQKLDRILTGVEKILDVTVDTHSVALQTRYAVGELSLRVSDNLNLATLTQQTLLRKLEDFGRTFLEDRENSCPRFLYLGTKNSSAWMPLRNAMSAVSPTVKVHVHFLCEARFKDYRLHEVKDQQGISLSKLKHWAKKILPWLKVTITILFLSAKIAANVVAPGASLIVPQSIQWQQASSLAEGIALATGYSKEELDKVTDSGLLSTSERNSISTPQELYAHSRKAMTLLLGKLSAEDFEQKLGLRKCA